jgi:hypothetical protein
MAITDESYFDWPVLPEAPSSLSVTLSGNSPKLRWELQGGDPKGTVIKRRIEKHPGNESQWKELRKWRIRDASGMTKGDNAAYRVRAYNDAGESAYSNIVHVTVLENSSRTYISRQTQSAGCQWRCP